MGNSCTGGQSSTPDEPIGPLPPPPNPSRAPIKTALLIGCNYGNTNNSLNGCINDVNNMASWLRSRGYVSITIMVDDGSSLLKPTRSAILTQLQNLAASSIPGDTIFLHYSGHGGQTVGGADENDGMDETIYGSNGRLEEITDDVLRSTFVDRLRVGVKLRCLFDSCNSASVLDLPYRCISKTTFVSESVALPNSQDCIELSACLDSETSMDTYIAGKYQGIATYSFLQAVRQHPAGTWMQILESVRLIMQAGKYDQLPQLCTGDKTLVDKVIDV